MPFQVSGKLNSYGEELFTLNQSAAILNFDQAFMYKLVKNLDIPHERIWGYTRPVAMLTHSMILKAMDCAESKTWKNGSRTERENLIRECISSCLNKESQRDPVQSGIKKTNELAKRLFQQIV